MKRKFRHGSVEEHPKGSGRWRVRARISGKLRVVVSDLVSRASAEEHADAYARERQLVELREGITLSQFGQGFLDRREKIQKARSIDEDRNRWKSYIELDPIGKVAVASLRRSDVVEWRDRLLTKRSRRGRHGLGPQTVKNALSLLRAALAEAADRDLLKSNPAADVKVPRGLGATHDLDLEGILLPADQQALIGAVPAAHRPAVLFALATGLRWSELSWLRWEDVSGDVVIVRRSRAGKPTKSGKPRRLPLLGPAKLALAGARELRRAGCPWVFPGPTKQGPRKQAPSHWPAWLARAGITKRVRFHDLRHTTATSLLAGWWGRKWSLEEVRQQLGHSSIQVTERYAHLLDETLEHAVSETPFELFPEGNTPLVTGENQCDDGAFLNRGSYVRIVSGAPT